MTDDTIERGAVLSPCERYRYVLTRKWKRDWRVLMYIMLNPSTADAEQDDPTIRKCVGFARRFGFGGIVVCNLFAWRATDPVDLRRAASRGEDIIGMSNNGYILAHAQHVDTIVYAWGTHAADFPVERIEGISALLCDLNVGRYCLGKTKWGHPRHPLMVPYSQELVMYA